MRSSALFSFLALPVLAGCGSGPTSPPPPPPPPSVASVRLSSSSASLPSGTSIELTATALDGSGQAIAGKTATWTTANASIAPVTAGGQVTGTRAGTAAVTATIDGKTADVQITVTVGAPTAIGVSSGDNQEAEVGTALGAAALVRVRDFGDNSVPDVPVTFAVGSGGGSIVGTATATTGSNGRAVIPVWRLGVLPGANTLVATAGTFTTAVKATAKYLRATADRPDEATGDQVHLIYAIPNDGTDRSLDVSGRLAISATVAQRLLATGTGGRRFKLDTFNGGAYDLTFVRLARTEARIRQAPFPVDSIEVDLAQSGILKPGKLYLVWYDGGSSNACAEAKLPPGNPGQVAALYLKGSFSGGTGQCLDLATGMAATATDAPRYWEFVGAHETLHLLGAVGTQAPHHLAARPGHVPGPTDLMFSGTEPWDPSVVDIGKDDYAGPGLATNLPNLFTTTYGETVPAAVLSLARQTSSRAVPWPMPRGVRIDQICGVGARRGTIGGGG